MSTLNTRVRGANAVQKEDEKSLGSGIWVLNEQKTFSRLIFGETEQETKGLGKKKKELDENRQFKQSWIFRVGKNM